MYKKILVTAVLFANMHYGESSLLELLRDGISAVYNGVDCGLYKLESWIGREPKPCNFHFFGSSKNPNNNNVHSEYVPLQDEDPDLVEEKQYAKSQPRGGTARKAKSYSLDNKQKIQPQEEYHGKSLHVGEKKFIILKKKHLDDINYAVDNDEQNEEEEEELVKTLRNLIKSEDTKF